MENQTPENTPNPSSPETGTPEPSISTPSTSAVDDLKPGFGWTEYAERLNGRFAMIGFVGLVLLELITGQDFLTWLGLH